MPLMGGGPDAGRVLKNAGLGKHHGKSVNEAGGRKLEVATYPISSACEPFASSRNTCRAMVSTMAQLRRSPL